MTRTKGPEDRGPDKKEKTRGDDAARHQTRNAGRQRGPDGQHKSVRWFVVDDIVAAVSCQYLWGASASVEELV
jgi:hypothetical protein